MSFFSKNIRFLRNKAQLSQTAFAKIFGLTRSTVGAYEEERAQPKMEMLTRMAQHFGISLEELIGKDIQSGEGNYKEAAAEGIPYLPESQIHLLMSGAQIGLATSQKVLIPGMETSDDMLAVEYCGNTLIIRELGSQGNLDGINPQRILVVRESGASILSATSGYDFRRAYEIIYIIKRYHTDDYVPLMLGKLSQKIDALAVGN